MAIFTVSLLVDFVAVVATLTAIIYAYFKWSYQYWKRRNLPYLEPTIPFGNLPNVLTSKLSKTDYIQLLYNEAKAKGWKHCGIYVMALPTYMVVDLDMIKNVMTKDFNHFMDRGLYVNEEIEPISCHLLALAGMRWKQLRAKLSPTFTSGKMKMMFQTMADCGVILEKYLKDNIADKDVVDIKEILGCFTTDIIGSCAFGVECNSFKDPNSVFRVYGKKIFEGRFLDLIKFPFCLSFPKAAKALGLRIIDKDVEDFYMKMVKDTVSYREKNNVTRKDFMQLLIAMKSKTEESGVKGEENTLTMNEIGAQCFLFFTAGFETSSSAMTFALFELAIHPEIQDRVREEIRTVLGRHDNKITYDSMNELEYMKQVLDETLRMYPALPIITRECIEDYKIPGEDVVLEKGTQVYIPVGGIHYDEDYYKNPLVFNPDRFSAENKRKLHPYAHLAFGQGPRVCIGERFGIMQTKIGLTSVLRNFKVSLNEKTAVPLIFDPNTLLPTVVGGIWLNLEKI